jgi:hypothetical protein
MKKLTSNSITTCLIAITALSISCKKDDGFDNYIIKPNYKDSISSCSNLIEHSKLAAFFPFTNGSLSDFKNIKYQFQQIGTITTTTDRYGGQCALAFNNDDENTTNKLIMPFPEFFFDLGQFTVSFWIKSTPDSSAVGKWGDIIRMGQEPNCDSTNNFLIDYHRENGWLGFPSNSMMLEGGVNRWDHIVYSLNQTNPEVIINRIFINGELQTSQELYSTNCENKIRNTPSMSIGNNFTGSLDDLAFFSKALSDKDVAKLYQLGNCCNTK